MLLVYILSTIIITIIVFLTVYAYQNTHSGKKDWKKTLKASFLEKQVILTNNEVLNYGEGPNNGSPLLLIHGQSMCWKDYATVLPELSQNFHVYAVDCHGHGKSSKNPKRYRCNYMGEDFIWFIQNIIQKPCFLSGLSSGGILAAWVAANAPNDILGLVLEDPPFFRVTPEAMQETFVWKDAFEIVHNFLIQKEEKDYVIYYLSHSYIFSLFGKLQEKITKTAKLYRKKHPSKAVKIWYLPYSILHGLTYIDDYDLLFGETFYDNTWMVGIDQDILLSQIICPTIYIKTTTKYGKDGVLYAANTDEDAQHVLCQLQKGQMIEIDSGHDIHYEKPAEFIKILNEHFLSKKLIWYKKITVNLATKPYN